MYPDFWAENKWKRVRRRAIVHDLLATLTAHHDDLLSFDEVTRRLKPRRKPGHLTEMIEVSKIVGSVGRYHDFTRQFLPRGGASNVRWLRLDLALNHLQPLPPIDVYKIGDVYFVLDGNHRVSVACANGLTHIEAHVMELAIRVPLGPDDIEISAVADLVDHLPRQGLGEQLAAVTGEVIGRLQTMVTLHTP